MAENRRREGNGAGGRGGTGESSSGNHGDKDKALQALKSQPWYWHNTTREEAERTMVGQHDGAFMIRDCSVPGDFTLTVRYNGCNKCVRIYKQKNGYSLSPGESDAPFSSLQELVEFYQQHSLASFNKRLDLRLQQAVSKPESAVSNQYSVFKELYDLSQQQLSAETRLSVLQQQRENLVNNVNMLDLMIPALRVVKQMYCDSMTQQTDIGPLCTMDSERPPLSGINRELAGLEETSSKNGGADASGADEDEKGAEDLTRSLSRDEEKSVTANTRLLMTRHTAVSSKLHSVRSHLDQDSAKLRELEADLQAVQLHMLRMKRTYDELIRQMVELGCDKEYLSQVLEPRVATREFDRSTWLVDCRDRDEAVAHLEKLPHGAFLVRRKDKRHLPYVLSIVVSSGSSEPSTIQHVYIVHPHGRGYGFNAALAVFESIDQLVLRHRYVSLKHYFKQVDVTLAFPVGCQELLRRSSESEKENASEKDGVYANAFAIHEAMGENLYEPIGFGVENPEDISNDNVSKSPKKNPYECVDASGAESTTAEIARHFRKGNLYEPVADVPRSSKCSSTQGTNIERVKGSAKDRPYEQAIGEAATSKTVSGSSKSSHTKIAMTDKDKHAPEENVYETIPDDPDETFEGSNADVFTDTSKEHPYEPVEFRGKGTKRSSYV
ncbi:phosphatidylinositol 3-kinase regulatory subunit gamma-like [Littorina saxatilis]|uniref:SH2 domain-containing protein n=1 Tax=Littorina saxatilis TaxID=31220 RepID=A0AAN9BBQ7_9CAEN